MLVILAWRNFVLQLPRRMVLLAFCTVGVGLLLVGNTILDNSDRNLGTTYRDTYTSDFVIVQKSTDGFNLFGSTVPLVGEYLPIPVLVDSNALAEGLGQLPGVAAVMPQVTVLAQVESGEAGEAGSARMNAALFGVDFAAHGRGFPRWKVGEGSVPSGPGPGAVVSRTVLESLQAQTSMPLGVGTHLVVTTQTKTSYVIRELPIVAVLENPSADELSARIIFVDLASARELAGLGVNAPEVKVDDSIEALLGGGLDVFGSGQSQASLVAGNAAAPTTMDGSSLGESLGIEGVGPNPLLAPGAVHFLLVRTAPGQDPAEVEASALRLVRDIGAEALVLPWRSAAGGMAELVVILRIIFNLGVWFIIAAVLVLLVNSISLATLDRYGEIGTIRALGGQRFFVAGLLCLENLILMTWSGLGAVVLAIGFFFLVNAIGFENSNKVLIPLLGQGKVALVTNPALALLHIVLTLGLGVLASINPLRIALAIPPVAAMRRE